MKRKKKEYITLNKKSKTIIWIVVAVVLVGFLGLFISQMLNAAQKVDFSELKNLIETGKIQELYLDGYTWTGFQIVNDRVVNKV